MEPRFPAWSWWDTLAVLGFTIFAVFLFSIVALAIARHFPAYRHMPLTDLATDARIVVGSQAAAYPLVLVFIYMLVRSRSRQRFRDAIHWNWPGITAPAFFVGGALLAVIVESLSSYLPIPKSLPMDNYFHNASSAYLLAAFGMSLAPLMEELFFRGMLYPLMRRAFRLSYRRAVDGGRVRRHPWSATGLCLGAHPQHLRRRHRLHRHPGADGLGGGVVSDALWL